MALTVTPILRTSLGSGRISIASVAFDSSYPTGGESLTPDDLGLRGVRAVIVIPSAGYVLEYDDENEKIIAFRQTDPADAGGADIALVEVADTTDLSTDLPEVFVIGIA